MTFIPFILHSPFSILHSFIAISISLIILGQPAIVRAEEQERKLLIITPGAHQDLSDADCMITYTNQIKDHIEFIENNPDASYSVGNTYEIQHFLKTYPKYKSRLKALMQKDRISAPALWVDLEPEWYTGEFLLREVAYAKYFLKKELDYDTHWSHLNDVPSITPQWAQILKKSDIDILIVNPLRMPQIPQISYYGAPDGSRMLTWSVDYDTLFDLVGGIDLNLLDPWIKNMNPLGYKLSQATEDNGISLDESRALLKTIRQWKNKYPSGTVIKLGTIQEFAGMATKTIKDKNIKLPVLTGRVFSWPWAGEDWCREAMRNHAMAENLLPAAEKLSAICELLGLEKYPLEEITHAWELILWGPDHNWGPKMGTGPMKARDNKESCELARKLLNQKLNRLASAVKYANKGKPLFVFNPLNWSRTEPVTVELPAGDTGGFSVIDAKGKATLAQISPGKKGNPLKLTFLAQDVPPMGYKCYYLADNSAGSQPHTDIKTGQDFIENQYYKIEANKFRGISSIYDKQHGHELLDQDSKYQLGYSDIGRDRIVPPFIPVRDIRVTAQGPLQASLELTCISDNKSYITRITLSAYSRNIDLKLEKGMSHCIAFPFNIGNSQYNTILGLAFGCIPDISEERYTYKTFRRLPEQGFTYNFPINYPQFQPTDWGSVAQMWFTQGGAEDDYAVDVALDNIQTRMYTLNDGRKKVPAIQVAGNSPSPLDYHMILRGHPGDWKAAHTPRLGWEINNPLLATIASGSGKLPEENSFITLEPAPKGQNIILSAFKKAFDGNGYVLRFYEAEDTDANVAVTVNPKLNIPKAEVSRTNLVEKPFKVLDSTATSHTIPVLGFGIETMRFFQTAVTKMTSPASNLAEITTRPPAAAKPAQITDLRAAGSGGASITLNWTATGGDGTQGRADQYDLRYSITPIDATTWFMATKTDKVISPAPAGKKESFTLSGLEPNSSYYIALKAIDEAGNESPISNVIHQSTRQLKSLTLQNGFNPTPPRCVHDTYISNINEEEQESNNADSHVMELWTEGSRVGLIKFDLSLLPPHSKIYQAKLKLYCLNVTYTDAGTVQCYRLTQNWKDTEATWKLAMNKMPWKGGLQDRIDTGSNYGLGDNGLIGQTNVKNGGMWVIWDVTKVLQEWNDGKYPNYGWLIYGKCSDDCGMNFCSSKYKKNTDLRPVLEIKYD